ncbi:WXG100 family type VII secretion target [Kitasatospora sp. NPDC101183]|uniref:WXG100 family type VII secretion target n=1 Tax=Kitasatospora sp. NPDC101183 TaxID=3364100 RepID=UPI0038114627
MAGETNFAGKSHDELYKMVEYTQPAVVLSRSQHLQSAGRVLNELSNALKSHIGNVNWDGQAGEQFKTWAGNLQQSAEKLSAYAADAGTAMHQAGEVLSTVKSGMPKVPTDAQTWVADRIAQKPDPVVVKNMVRFVTTPNPGPPSASEIDSAMAGKTSPSTGRPWVSETMAMAGTREVYMAHQEAIHQMEKLGQAYSAATTALNGLGTDVVLPGTPGDDGAKHDSTTASGGGGGGYVGSGGSQRRPRSSGGSGGGSYRASAANYTDRSVSYRDPGTNTWESTSGSPGSPSSHGGGQVPTIPQDPGHDGSPSSPSVPIDHTGTGLDSLPPTSTLPNPTIPGNGPFTPDGPGGTPYPGGPSTPGSGPGIPGAGPGYPTGGQGPGFPVGGGSSPIPVKGGGSGTVRPGPFGGGRGPGNPATPSLPTGKVFGLNEAGPPGGSRGGMPMGGMPMGMGGHGGGGSGGGSRGRGLTSTPGGVVGGRKGPAAGGEFTPGGTGLRNRAGAGAAEGGARGQGGMMAPGMAGHGGRSERERRKRADYLHEDEETWTTGTPYSNPDVVE